MKSRPLAVALNPRGSFASPSLTPAPEVILTPGPGSRGKVIEHRLIKLNHPWTNGQVERMNRTIGDATVKRSHFDSHERLRSHIADFLDAKTYARRLKTLKGLTLYECI